MKKRYIVLLVIWSSIIFMGCNKFLDVTPKSTVADDRLFMKESGFEHALNGVYSSLSSESLYGDNLSMGYLSALAKNYSITATSHRFYYTTTFNYNNAPQVETIWNKAYANIAAINNILSHIDEKKDLFTGDTYSLIKGESLALRAFIHFDLLRLFGQHYESNPQAMSIPYRTVYELSVKTAGTSQEVVNKVLDDLQLAEDLLMKDPIKKGDLDRRYRMNYYAVMGLKARIYTYINDVQNAKKYAEAVVNSELFPFVDESAIATTNAGKKDRVFTPELVFALRSKNMARWTEGAENGSVAYFRYRLGGVANYTLTLSEENYRQLFEAGLYGSDYRYMYLFESDDRTTAMGSGKYPSKFWQTWMQLDESSYDRKDQTVPLLRLSEMYYILAYNASLPVDGLLYLNKVRQHRGIPALSSSDVTDRESLVREITKEYQKEFYAEGQTFFWYKYIKASKIPFYTGEVLPINYLLPIPPTELEYNPSYE